MPDVRPLQIYFLFLIFPSPEDHFVHELDVYKRQEADYFGVESGNRISDKFERSGLTASKSTLVDAPIINEFPLCLECKFIEYQNNEYGCGVIGKVVNVTADEKVMIDDKLDMSLVNAIAFDPVSYTHLDVYKRQRLFSPSYNYNNCLRLHS